MTEAVSSQATYALAVQEYIDSCTRLSNEAITKLKKESDICYGTHERQKLDIYMPKEAVARTMPVLLFMHGGAWRHGNKDWMGFMAPSITALPAIFVSVGYRLASDAKYPGAEDDCRAALIWTYNNIVRYGGDPERLYVGGHSAGGHLAAMLALRPNVLLEQGLPEGVIKGCFPMAGVFDLSTSKQDSVENFLPSMDLVDEASPVTHVAGNKVPFYISIGEKDNPPLIPQASQMADALTGQGSHVEFLCMIDCDHFQMNLQAGDQSGEWARTVRQWMDSPPGA